MHHVRHAALRRVLLSACSPAVLLAGVIAAQPAMAQESITVEGKTYVNQGLVGVGRIAADARDKFGETLGSMSGLTFDRAATATLPVLPLAYNGKISLDPEGIVRLADGSFFISDEYGPYIYRFSADGKMLSAIRPPDALIPIRNGGID